MSDQSKDRYIQELAELVLDMGMATPRGQYAAHLARKVLGIPTIDVDERAITTNGTTRFIPMGEPVFLIRAQDIVSGEAVRAWAKLAEIAGASDDIVQGAREHAALMDAWPVKKTPDLPGRAS